MLTLITIIKDDINSLVKSIKSTNDLRKLEYIQQIIVDSSNVDNSLKIKEFLLHEQNVKYVYQDPQGIAKAFNYGISLSPDGWLWFLNGGDGIHPKLDLDLFLKILQQTQADVIIFDIELHTGEITKHPPLPYLWPPLYNWIPHPGTLIKSKILHSIKGFREDFKIAMDGELWFRLFKQNLIVDLVAIPIVQFDKPGLSGNVSATALESKKIIELYKKTLIVDWLKYGLRIFRAWYEFRKLSRKN